MKEGSTQMWTMNDQRVLLVACPVNKQRERAGNKHKDMTANQNL